LQGTSTTGSRSSADSMNRFENIPREMKELKQWVLWRLQKRKGQAKATKIPFQVNGKGAKSNDPSTWNTYENVLERYNRGGYSGIGFVFNRDYTGMDIDGCVTDGVISEKAMGVIKLLDSYTEFSQSGKGIHVIMKALVPGDKNATGDYEFYDHGRYFVMTGDLVPGLRKTIEERQAQLDKAYGEIFKNE